MNQTELFFSKEKLYFLKIENVLENMKIKLSILLLKIILLYSISFSFLDLNLFWRLLHKKRVTLNAHDIDSFQRNMVTEGLSDCKDEDIIILSDVDEIPDPKIISQIDPGNNRYTLEMQNFYYYLNGKLFEKNNLTVS